MSQLTARERRLVAVAILVGLIAVLWFGVASPILGGFAERKQQRDDAVDTLRRNSRLIASYSDLRGRLGMLTHSAASWAVQAPSTPAAMELARARVTRAVTDSGGVLEALRDQPGRPDAVRLQADVQIDLGGLQTLVRKLENDHPYASVNLLSVAASDTPGSQHSSPLQVRIDVSFSYVASR